MRFLDLIKGLRGNLSGAEGDPVVTDICYDSRRVTKGAVFAAVKGSCSDGNEFITQAVESGASAVVSENTCDRAVPVPWFKTDDVRKTMGEMASRLWYDPYPGVYWTGITGTNGKTTVAFLFQKLFSEFYDEESSWMFGTVKYLINGEQSEAERTTPEAVDIFRSIKTAKKAPKAVTMEASSHAIDQARIWGIRYDLCIWLNLTRDHLDYHADMVSYYNAKRKLFTSYLKDNGYGVINMDDSWGRKLYFNLRESGRSNILTFGESDESHFQITDSKCSWEGTEITLRYKGESTVYKSVLIGLFNRYNMAALIAGATAAGIPKETVMETLNAVKTIPGRMEKVWIDRPYTAVVDYAHTPDALENVLKTARELTKKRLICVFGCGGNRDKTKRRRMARKVVKYCDRAVVTNDNPRDENPEEIVENILDGIPLDYPHRVIEDRRAGIRYAMSEAKRNDCIIIAGKGHETYQEIAGERHHFDDREVVRELDRDM